MSAASGIAPAGNTPTSNVFSSANNRITSASYDAAGNQTVVNGNALTYDAESRVRQVTDSGGTESILYDGSGDRIEKVVAGVGRIYVYDALGTLAAEYSAAAAGTYPCTTCYLSADQIGSTRLVTDQNANVVARHDFLPFGEEITSTGGRTAQWGSTTDVEQKFTGQLRDTESGLDFFNARYYGYALNRFTSPDPGNAGADPSNPQSWNGYAYVMNNPLVNVDPGGLDCVTFDDGSTGDDGQGTSCPGSQTSQTIDVNGGVSYQIGDQTPGNVEYGFGLNFGRVGSTGGGGAGPGAMNLVYTPPNSGGSVSANTGSLGLTSRQACYADALVNGALGFIPGYNATKTVASLVGFNFNPVQFANGNTGPTTGFSSGASPFAAGSPTGPQVAAGIASAAAIGADGSYAVAGGAAALNRATELISRGSFALQSAARQAKLLQQAASLERLAQFASAAKNLGTVFSLASTAFDLYQCSQRP